MSASEIHNRIVPDIIERLIRATGSQADCMVALESIILGVMKFYAPNPRHAGEFMDSMTMAVIERMGAQKP